MQRQAYAEEQGLLGSLCSGQKKLLGKTFYLDSVKKRPTALLLETISLLGGGVESFLHKDVSFVVTGNQECLKEQKCTDTKLGAKGTGGETQHPIMMRESVLSNEKRRPGTPRPMACGSRGKALLEKAIRNNEQLQKSSVLANARSWGVKILYVDDILLYLRELTRESFSKIHRRPEKTYSKQQSSHVVKAAPLKSPYLKIEDMSRKYKPLHIQSMTFPSLWYSGRFSPFESPPPPFEKWTEQVEKKTREKTKMDSSIRDKSSPPLSCNPSPWKPRKKDLSYCECCHQPFSNLEEHLQSDQHRAFVLELSNYAVVDQLVAEMLPGFNPNPPKETLSRPPTPLCIQDVCELEPLNDAEAEHAIQTLQRQGSSLNTHISSPARSPVGLGPGSPSPGVSCPLPNPASPPADIQPSTTDTNCQIPDRPPHASSPAMPVLDVEPPGCDSAGLQSYIQRLSPCPDTPCPSPDPYSLPPVLSPQVPFPAYVWEPHSSYAEVPVLSPHKYSADTVLEQHHCERETSGSVFQSVPAVTVPISTPFLPPGASANAERVKGPNIESLSELRDSKCVRNGWKCDSLFLRRSRSLPRWSATSRNPKKRCRSASPKHSWSKRRRITAEFHNKESWNKSVKPESDMTNPEGWLSDKVPFYSCPEISSICAGEPFGVKQTLAMFGVPSAHNFSHAPGQIDMLGQSSTSVSHQPSQPLCSAAKNSDCSHQSANSLCSQDSQCPPSHSKTVGADSFLLPDLAMLSSPSSDSDWDCDLLSRLGPSSVAPPVPTEQSCEVDKELLHRPCTWMQDSSYESRLHTVLQPPPTGPSLYREEMDSSGFSRTVVKIVEVQH